jgi:hypothetical protein
LLSAGEVRVNLGGEPERDDFGLPPVDIEIPDDARELARDVQAYYREQRALRRHLRHRRWGSPMARDGMVLPLLAACLVLALIAGTLLTVFTAGPGGDPARVPGSAGRTAGASVPPSAGASTGSRASAAAPRSPVPAVTAVAGRTSRLPNATIGLAGGQLRLGTVKASVLALVPAACGCAEAVRELIFQAHQADVPLFLVHASGRLPAAVEQVASRSGWSSLRVADDVRDVLGKTYNQTGLTAILVDSRGMVSLAHQLRPGLQLASKFEMLRAGTPAPSPPQ